MMSNLSPAQLAEGRRLLEALRDAERMRGSDEWLRIRLAWQQWIDQHADALLAERVTAAEFARELLEQIKRSRRLLDDGSRRAVNRGRVAGVAEAQFALERIADQHNIDLEETP